MTWRIRQSAISGEITVPGDKSISHRALMLAALARGESRISNLAPGEDVRSTAHCLAALGAGISLAHDSAAVRSSGRLSAPPDELDAGNSGTTMRLLAGIAAGQPFRSKFVGDESLSRRPMGRVVDPLERMGARIRTDGGRPPLEIEGGNLAGIHYRSPVASAQVKSAVLLAGLFAQGETSISLPAPARDHTERMLAATGVETRTSNGTVWVTGGHLPDPFICDVPGDISSAAFLFAAAALTGSALTIRDLGVNPTRGGFLSVLERMGCRVSLVNQRESMNEPVADVSVSGSVSEPIEIGAADVPGLIDELPLIALLGTQARGTTVVRGAEELRVKESDRIEAVVRRLGALGADVEEARDGFTVRGRTPLHGVRASSGGDHRVGMMLAVAGLIATGETIVDGTEAAAISYPDFEGALRRLGGSIDAV